MSSRHSTDEMSGLGRREVPGLSIARSATSGGPWVSVTGELDLASAQAVDDALRQAERDARSLVLDLRELTFMDAAGLAVVIDADARARKAGRRFVVRMRSTRVRRLFELTRAERSLEVVIDPEAPTFSRDGSGPPAWSSPDVPDPFRWDVVREDGSVRVVPVGELDLVARERLESAIDELRRSGVDRLVLDLRGISFLDSSGIRLVLELHAAARGDGFELHLIPGPPQVQRVFELTGTLDALPFAARASTDGPEPKPGAAGEDGPSPR